jgi:transcription initiation factor IIE alpha subunit
MILYKTAVIFRRALNSHTEKCTICGQDVEYLEHMRVQHQINEPFSIALRNLQRRIQDLEKEVAARHGH